MQEKIEKEIVNIKIDNPKTYYKLKTEAQKRIFKQYDYQLDQKPYGACHLKQKEIAEIIKLKLHEYDTELYDLIAYCIMPNHVHVLFDTSIQLTDENDLLANEVPKDYVQLHDIMQLIKGGSSFLINKALNRKGPLWQKDSYDHFVRDDKEFGNIVNYILQNPVKAGLVESWQDFPYSYYSSG